MISLYAKGMTTGDIQAHLFDIYGTEISRDTISRITDAVVEDLIAWQNRPLDRVYPVLLIDAIVVRARMTWASAGTVAPSGRVRPRAIASATRSPPSTTARSTHHTPFGESLDWRFATTPPWASSCPTPSVREHCRGTRLGLTGRCLVALRR